MISKYNIFHKINDEYLIYNMVSRKVLSVNKHVYISLKEKKEELLNDEQTYELCKYGFLHMYTIDEYAWLINKYYDAIHSMKLHIIIMASTACNFKCSYCYENYKPMKINEDFISSFLLYIKKNIKNFDGLHIEWFGGEPLLAKNEIFKLSQSILEICKSNKKPYISSITTNGYLLNLDTFRQLLNAKVIFFQVTIDGNKLTHNKLRPLIDGGNTYDVILDNLLDIKKTIPSYKYFKIIIRNNLFAGNLSEGKKFIHLFKQEFSDDPRFELYQFPIKDWGGNQIKKISCDNLLGEIEIVNQQNKYSFSDLEESMESTMCYSMKKNAFVVDPKNYIYKCSHYIQNMECKNKRNCIGQITPQGNIELDETLMSQWNIRKVSELCRNCSLLPYCMVEKCPIYEVVNSDECFLDTNKKIVEKLELYYMARSGRRK